MTPEELDRIGKAFAARPNLRDALEVLLIECRRLTRAEAGTVYLREAGHLEFSLVQNDALAAQLGEAEARQRLTAAPLDLTEPSIASYVLLTRATVNLPDAYEIPVDRPYTFYRQLDMKNGYRTQSMLVLPLRDARSTVFGVIQLINALDAAGTVIPFGLRVQYDVEALVAHVAPLIHVPRASGE